MNNSIICEEKKWIFLSFVRRKNENPFRSENKNSWLKAFEATILGKNTRKNPQPEIKSPRFLNAQLKTIEKNCPTDTLVNLFNLIEFH